jgi:hypothetical protein
VMSVYSMSARSRIGRLIKLLYYLLEDWESEDSL